MVAARVLPRGSAPCPVGGIKVDSCSDTAAKGRCDETTGDEVQSKILCNTDDTAHGGVAAALSMLRPGHSVCTYGGIEVSVYRTHDGVPIAPSVDEAPQQEIFCNSIGDGGEQLKADSRAVHTVKDVPVGDSHCPTGGKLIEMYTANGVEKEYNPALDQHYAYKFLCSDADEDFAEAVGAKGGCGYDDGKTIDFFKRGDNQMVQERHQVCDGRPDGRTTTVIVAMSGTGEVTGQCPKGGVQVTACASQALPPTGPCEPASEGYHEFMVCNASDDGVQIHAIDDARSDPSCQGRGGFKLIEFTAPNGQFDDHGNGVRRTRYICEPSGGGRVALH